MKVGLVGCGVAVEHHLPGLLSVPGREVVLCDTDEQKMERLAQRVGAKNSYSDFKDMLRAEKPDAVHIMTPPKTHADLSMMAAGAGSHILVEKPMAMTVEECELMIEAARKNKVSLCVMHNHLFDPMLHRARQMIRDGELGDIVSVECQYCLDEDKMAEEKLDQPEHWAHDLPLGIFGEYTPHLLYLILPFIGPVVDVQASRREIQATRGAIPGLNVGLNGQQAFGHLLMLTRMPYAHFQLHIYGTRKALHINMMDLTMTVKRELQLPKTAARMTSTLEQSLQSVWGLGTNTLKILSGRLKRRPGHRALITGFYESLQANSAPPVSGEEGREVVRAIELIHQTLKTKFEVYESKRGSSTAPGFAQAEAGRP